MDTVAQQSPLFNKLSNLRMPDELRMWSSQKKFYNDHNISHEDISELITLATNIKLFGSESEEEFWIPVHAWRILCELHAKEAASSLIETFDTYYESDYASEELPTVIASIAEGTCLDQLSLHVLDKSKHLYSRTMALRAIELTTNEHKSTANQCIEILDNCLNESDGDWPSFNGFLISSLMTLNAVSKINTISKAFNEDIVDLTIVGDLEDVEMALGLRKVRDTNPPRFPHSDLSYFFNDINETETNTSYKTKIGRNAPCPCGSDKKYKKCCINN
jgi:hypothetical protein